MRNDNLLPCMLAVFFALFILISMPVFKPEYPQSRSTIALNEVSVKVPGLESAYNWLKKLTAQGYFVEIRPINEPGYLYEVHGIRYDFPQWLAQ